MSYLMKTSFHVLFLITPLMSHHKCIPNGTPQLTQVSLHLHQLLLSLLHYLVQQVLLLHKKFLHPHLLALIKETSRHFLYKIHNSLLYLQ